MLRVPNVVTATRSRPAPKSNHLAYKNMVPKPVGVGLHPHATNVPLHEHRFLQSVNQYTVLLGMCCCWVCSPDSAPRQAVLTFCPTRPFIVWMCLTLRQGWQCDDSHRRKPAGVLRPTKVDYVRLHIHQHSYSFVRHNDMNMS